MLAAQSALDVNQLPCYQPPIFENKMPKKLISRNEFVKLAPTMTRNQIARHFGIADMTAQKLASQLGIKFKKFVPKPTGRKPIKFTERNDVQEI